MEIKDRRLKIRRSIAQHMAQVAEPSCNVIEVDFQKNNFLLFS